MAFQPGNKLAGKSRLFDGALKRAIAQDEGERLRQAAEKLLDLAASGEPWAINALADRLDGKAQQTVTVSHSDVETMSLVELAAEVAALRTGDSDSTGGANESSPVH